VREKGEGGETEHKEMGDLRRKKRSVKDPNGEEKRQGVAQDE